MIITGHESGKVAMFDAKTGEEVLNNERAHMDTVTDMQLSPDRTYFITSSKDKTARVCSILCCPVIGLFTSPFLSQIHDTKTLTVLKTFSTETPLNSASLAPKLPYVR